MWPFLCPLLPPCLSSSPPFVHPSVFHLLYPWRNRCYIPNPYMLKITRLFFLFWLFWEICYILELFFSFSSLCTLPFGFTFALFLVLSTIPPPLLPSTSAIRSVLKTHWKPLNPIRWQLGKASVGWNWPVNLSSTWQNTHSHTSCLHIHIYTHTNTPKDALAGLGQKSPSTLNMFHKPVRRKCTQTLFHQKGQLLKVVMGSSSTTGLTSAWVRGCWFAPIRDREKWKLSAGAVNQDDGRGLSQTHDCLTADPQVEPSPPTPDNPPYTHVAKDNHKHSSHLDAHKPKGFQRHNTKVSNYTSLEGPKVS